LAPGLRELKPTHAGSKNNLMNWLFQARIGPLNSNCRPVSLSGRLKSPQMASEPELAGSDQATGLQLSLFLERAATEGDAEVAREFYWKRMQASPFKMEDVRFSERNGAAVLEYIVKEASWKNMNLYLSHDGYWVDLHISKILFRSADKEYFDAVLNNIKIVSSQRGRNAASGSRKPFSFSLPQRGKLILTIPNSWKRSARKSDKGLPPTIILSPRKGGCI
jgi:hypothetical protein